MIDPTQGNRIHTCFIKDGKKTTAPLTWLADDGERPTDEWLLEQGYYGYVEGAIPEYDIKTEKVVPVPVENLQPMNGLVVGSWDIVELTDAEKVMAIENAWNNLRRKRNTLLDRTDWTQVPDSRVNKESWAAYRQQLRDLPNNTSDPFNVIWPTDPDST